MTELREIGLQRERECVLALTVAAIDRCIDEYRQRGSSVGVGWLADLMRRGGPTQREVTYVSTRQRILTAMNAWKDSSAA